MIEVIDTVRGIRKFLTDKIPYRDEKGNIAGVIGFAQDITKLKLVENELSESEKRYRTLFNAIDEGFCIIEVIFDENEKPIDYRFIEINPSFEKQTGLINAQGKRMRELAPKHEDHWFEIYGKIAVTGQPARFVNRAEQLHRWYDVYAFRFGQPENRQVAILFKDITERKQVEEALFINEVKYKALIDNINSGVAVYEAKNDGEDFTFVDFNKAGEGIENIKREKLIGKSVNKMFPGVKGFGLF
ncbi:MAG: PAS domain-containing protein, partial [Desulfatiglandaceae bacterium]